MANGAPEVFGGTKQQRRGQDPLDPLGRYGPGDFQGPRTEQDILEEDRDRLREIRSKRRIAQRYAPEVGPLAIPRVQSFQAYRNVQDSGLYDVEFSSDAYEVFDSVVAQSYGKDALGNARHDRYEHLAPLRRNLAIVRNYIYSQYFPDGEYNSWDKEDVQNAAKLPAIAKALGKGLKHSWVAKIPLLGHLFNSLNADLAADPKQGAAAIYEHLVRRQNHPSLLNPLSWIKRSPGKNWNLPSVEDSIFSQANLHTQQIDIDSGLPGAQQSKAGEMLNNAFYLEQISRNLRTPEQLQQPVLDRSVELAREILDKFRIVGGNTPRNSSLAINDEDKADQSGRLLDLALIYQDYVSSIAHENPALLQSPVFEDTRRTLRRLSYHIKLQALEEMKREGHPDAQRLMTEIIKSAGPEWQMLKNTDFQRLAANLEAGLEEAARRRGQSLRRAQAVSPAPAQQQATAIARDMNNTMSNMRVTQVNHSRARTMAQKANQQRQVATPPPAPEKQRDDKQR